MKELGRRLYFWQYRPGWGLSVFNGMVMLLSICLILVNQQNTRWTIKELELREPSVSAEFDRSLRNAFSDGLAEEVQLDAGTDMIVSDKQYYGMYERGAALKELTGSQFQWSWYEEINSLNLDRQSCYALSSGSGWVMSGPVADMKCDGTGVIVNRIWLYCDGVFNTLMTTAANGIEFLPLEDADEIKKCSKGNIYIFDDLNYDINKLTPVNYSKYKLGTRFPVTMARRDIGAYLYWGISDREDGFTWTSDKTADMYFELEDTESENIRTEVTVKMVYGDKQPVNIFVNGVNVYSEVLKGASQIEFEFTKPEDGIVNLHFELQGATAPVESGAEEDIRQLGIAMDDMVLEGIWD